MVWQSIQKINTALLLLCMSVGFITVVVPEQAYAQNPFDAGSILNAPSGDATPATSVQPYPTASRDAGNVEIPGFTGMVYSLCLALGGGLLWLSGALLDFTFVFLVVGMGDLLKGGLGDAVDALWVVIRDVFNLLFIFGLIYIGFKTIWSAVDNNTKRMLVYLIAAALLVNFSLYFTKVIVDLTNVTALQIYKLIEVEGAPGVLFSGSEYTGVASGFMQYLNLETLSNQNGRAAMLTQAVADEGNLPNARIMIYGFMVLIFSLIAAFVFAAGAIFLVTRFVALILFMIFSPAMMLGWVYPGLKSYSDKWWKGFISYALVAPTFIFMLYLSLTVAKELQTGGTFAEALGDTSFTSGTFQLVLMFFVIIGFVVASLMVAKSMSDAGAAQAGRAASYVQGKIGNVSHSLRRSAQGFAGRNIVGRGSNFAQNTFKRWQEKPSEKQSRLGRAARLTLKSTNLDRSIIGTTEKGKAAKFGSKYSFKDNQDYDKDRTKRLSAGAAEQRREAQINAGIAATASTAVGPLNPNTMKDFATAMKNLTDKQLTEELKLEVLTNENVAIHLSEKNIETLEKSGKYSDAQIGDIKEARKAGFKNIANTVTRPGSAFNTERTPEWLAQKGTDEVAKMPTEVFTAPAMASHLTPGMVEAKMKSGLGTTDRDAIRDNIDNAIRADKAAHPSIGGAPAGGALTKQWSNWVNRTTIGPRLGLQEV